MGLGRAAAVRNFVKKRTPRVDGFYRTFIDYPCVRTSDSLYVLIDILVNHRRQNPKFGGGGGGAVGWSL